MGWISQKNIIIPTDLTDLSIFGIRTAMEMVNDPLTQLTVVYVLPPLEPCEPGVLWDAIDTAKRIENTQQSLKQYLRRNDLPSLKTEVLIGDAGREIVALAKQMKTDLIVIPSYSRGILSRWILGSVTDYLLHHAPCPVLFLKAQHTMNSNVK